MAKPIEPTPEIATREDLDRFLKNMNKPSSEEKIKQIKEAKETYSKAKFIDYLP